MLASRIISIDHFVPNCSHTGPEMILVLLTSPKLFVICSGLNSYRDVDVDHCVIFLAAFPPRWVELEAIRRK